MSACGKRALVCKGCISSQRPLPRFLVATFSRFPTSSSSVGRALRCSQLLESAHSPFRQGLERRPPAPCPRLAH